MKTGNTTRRPDDICKIPTPQWSPVMKTGNTCGAALAARTERQASMEPGHEDREYSTARTATRAYGRCLNGARS